MAECDFKIVTAETRWNRSINHVVVGSYLLSYMGLLGSTKGTRAERRVHTAGQAW